jgi:hypothetical protein
MFLDRREGAVYVRRAKLYFFLAFSVWLGVVGTVVYVACHFISKYW